MPHARSRNDYDYDVEPRRVSKPSKTDRFLDALDGGHFKDAVDTILPGQKSGGSTTTSHGSRRSHSHHRPSRHTYDDVDRDGYYYDKDPYYHDDRRHHRRRGSTRGDYHDYERTSRPRERSRRASSTGPDFGRAGKAAVAAGVVEAFRSRHDPQQYKRALTSAAGAAATEMLASRGDERHGKRHVAEGALGGLVLDRLVNGKRL